MSQVPSIYPTWTAAAAAVVVVVVVAFSTKSFPNCFPEQRQEKTKSPKKSKRKWTTSFSLFSFSLVSTISPTTIIIINASALIPFKYFFSFCYCKKLFSKLLFRVLALYRCYFLLPCVCVIDTLFFFSFSSFIVKINLLCTSRWYFRSVFSLKKKKKNFHFVLFGSLLFFTYPFDRLSKSTTIKIVTHFRSNKMEDNFLSFLWCPHSFSCLIIKWPGSSIHLVVGIQRRAGGRPLNCILWMENRKITKTTTTTTITTHYYTHVLSYNMMLLSCI